VIRFCGHTMGTPESTPEESIELFAALGLGGIEFVCDESSGVNVGLSSLQRSRLAARAHSAGLEVVCLTPYQWEIANADKQVRAEQVHGLVEYVLMAAEMGCRRVRAYGGREVAGPARSDALRRAAASLREVAEATEALDVILCVENHMGTLTRGGRETMELLRLVAHPRVQVLYDPANAQQCSGETWEETWRIQSSHLSHVHAKDFALEGDKRAACLIGAGVVPWREIMVELREANYTGFVSLEYEKKWYPDMLPDAGTGMAQCVRTLKSYRKA